MVDKTNGDLKQGSQTQVALGTLSGPQLFNLFQILNKSVQILVEEQKIYRYHSSRIISYLYYVFFASFPILCLEWVSQVS